MKPLLTIALIGRPNVGKSTLYNRLTRSDEAIVDNRPGVTRDWREGEGKLADLRFNIIDTAGLEEAKPTELTGKMYAQTSYVVDQADLILIVVDGTAGVTTEDEKFARVIRATGKEIILVVNKCESAKKSQLATEAYRLGFEQTIFISAAHGENMVDLYEAITSAEAWKKAEAEQASNQEMHGVEQEAAAKHISLAILGRPNAGKSTFVNNLLGQQRMITSDIAGTTRDSIKSKLHYQDYEFTLVDTAGIRKRSNIVEHLEKLSVADSFKALRYAHVVVLMVDATAPLERQDLKIAEKIVEEGRALVLVVNKVDLIPNLASKQEEVNYLIDTSFPAFRDLPIVYVSALTNPAVTKVLEVVIDTYKRWNKRITTSKLNDWLQRVTHAHPLPLMGNGRRVKLKYITQAKARPPTFMLSSNNPEGVTETYRRYLMNAIRREFGMEGVPLRLNIRKASNPFKNR